MDRPKFFEIARRLRRSATPPRPYVGQADGAKGRRVTGARERQRAGEGGETLMDVKADLGCDQETDWGADAGLRLLYVPVHTGASGTVTIQAGHLPSGQAVGLGFTSPTRLAMVFGPQRPWIKLHLSALHEMLEPLGITLVRIDPLRAPGLRDRKSRDGLGRRGQAGLAPSAGAPATSLRTASTAIHLRRVRSGGASAPSSGVVATQARETDWTKASSSTGA